MTGQKSGRTLTNGKLLRALTVGKAFFYRLPSLVGFRLVMTVLILSAQMAVSGYILVSVYGHVRESKLRDVWAILFLDMERMASIMSERLLEEEKETITPSSLVSEVEIDKKGHLTLIQGSFLPLKTMSLARVDRPDHLAEWNLLFYLGGSLILKKTGVKNGKYHAYLKKHNVTIKIPPKAEKETIIYVASRQSVLVYSSTPEVNATNLTSRPLVQHFIRVPVAQSQVDLSSSGSDTYGFFTEIPKTNLVIFAETSKRVVTAPVMEMVLTLSKNISIIVIVSLVILQMLLFYLLKPIKSLGELSNEIAKGNFQVRSPHRGFGEILQLTDSFHQMGENLISRDLRIQGLMRDQLEKTRLANELLVAREIQDSLLPKEPIPPDSGLVIDAIYIPASEVAGDWFQYAYDAVSRKTLVALVDISGHGTGASMYTAITGAIFSEFLVNYFKGVVDETHFFESLDRNLKEFGKGKWSATGQLFVFDGTNSTLTTINAGHTPPMLRLVGKDFRQQSMPSAILGMPEELQISKKSFSFPPGSYIVSYTDGLSDRTNPTGKPLGVPGIRKILGTLPDGNPAEMIKSLTVQIENYAQGNPAHDDTCIVVIKAA